MNMLSGGNTPLESMPPWLGTSMQASPSTYFVCLRSRFSITVPHQCGPQFLAVALIDGLFFSLAVLRF